MNVSRPVKGDSYKDILLLWAPELVTQALFVYAPVLFDSYLISLLRSTTAYATHGVASDFLHVLLKISEAIPVAIMTTVGMYNGAKEFNKVGKALGNGFWSSVLVGGIPALMLFFFSQQIAIWQTGNERMALLEAPYLKLRALGLFLTFVAGALFAFMRGIKNTRTPMHIFLIGFSAYFIVDYALILGKWGMPQLGLEGSAIASIVEYSLIIALSLVYILSNKEYKKYFPEIFILNFDRGGIFKIISMSWQITIDKAALGFAYVELSRMIAPMGKHALASYNVVKNLERFAFIPAIAFASILSFLVSNRIGAGDIEGARANIKRILVVTSISVLSILFIICINPAYFIEFFDPRNKFTDLAAKVLPVVSSLAAMDFLQIIFAGALRGAGDVTAVMTIRAISCFGFFYFGGWWLAGDAPFPVSLFSKGLSITDPVMRMSVLYGLFYVNTGIMGLMLFARLRFKNWQPKNVALKPAQLDKKEEEKTYLFDQKKEHEHESN